MTKILYFRLWSCLLVSLFLTGNVPGKDEQYVSYPLPLNIDYPDKIESTLYIKFKEIQYDIFWDDFSPTSDSEIFLSECIAIYKDGNVDELRNIIKNPLPENTEKALLKIMHAFFVNQGNYFKLFTHVLLERGGVFLCGVDSVDTKANSSHVFGVKYELNDSGDYVWDLEAPTGPLVSSFIFSYRNHKDNSSVRVSNKESSYAYPIHGAGSENAVYLLFDGTLYDFEIKTDTPDPNDVVLAFYQEAWQTYLYKPYQDYAEYFTDKSRQKILNSGKKGMENGSYIGWQELYRKGGRLVYFILNADPLYIVFYGKEVRPSGGYHFIVRDVMSDQFKLTNHYYIQYIDELLNSKNFRNNTLKDIKRRSELAFYDSKIESEVRQLAKDVGELKAEISAVVSEIQEKIKPQKIEVDYPDLMQNSPVYGDPNAPVKIVFFDQAFDFNCQAEYQKIKMLLEEYPSQVALIYMHAPYLSGSFRKITIDVHVALDLAFKTKGNALFWEFRDQFDPNRWQRISQRHIRKLVADAGLDVKVFDLNKEKLTRFNTHLFFKKDYEASKKLQIQKIPSVYVNDQFVGTMSIEEYRKVIEEILELKTSK